MIQTSAELNNFLSNIKTDTELAVDTEFKRVNTFYPQLCLVQIATKNHIDCIDVLAIKDLTPLFNKLFNKDTLWIVHSARQDIEALFYLSKKLPYKLFDTQVAASMSGYPMQVSYQALTESLQNIYLDKAFTRLDWTTRPLPEGAIKYALDDVKYLLKNYHNLSEILNKENKIKWLEEDAQELLNINTYIPKLTDAWKKVKGINKINRKHHALAVELAAWREYQAINKNKPRKWIMADEKLISYAQGREKLSKDARSSFNSFIKDNNITTTSIKINKNKVPSATEKARKNELQKLIQQKADAYNLDSGIIANGKSLLQYIRGDQSVKFNQGWRYEILQGELKNAK